MDFISEEYRKLNIQLHQEKSAALRDYGRSGRHYVDSVSKLCRYYNTIDALDYGCGKGTLKDALPDIDIKEYDPAIEGKEKLPQPADIVICNDVLEHIEPEYLDAVLVHLKSLMRIAGLFVIATVPAKKCLSDGRNTHLIVQPPDWWQEKLSEFSIVTRIDGEKKSEFYLEAK